MLGVLQTQHLPDFQHSRAFEARFCFWPSRAGLKRLRQDLDRPGHRFASLNMADVYPHVLMHRRMRTIAGRPELRQGQAKLGFVEEPACWRFVLGKRDAQARKTAAMTPPRRRA